MRRAYFMTGLLWTSLALAACHKEPDFDARYDEAQSRIKATAADLDKDMSGEGDAEPAPTR